MSCRELFFFLPRSLSLSPLFVFSRLIIYSTTRNGMRSGGGITSGEGCGKKDGEECSGWATIPMKLSSENCTKKRTKLQKVVKRSIVIPVLEERRANLSVERESAAVFSITHANGRRRTSRQWRVMQSE